MAKPKPVKVLYISRIAETRPRSVTVIEHKTGKEIRFPRSQVDFWPGRVIIPLWLYNKMGLDGVLRTTCDDIWSRETLCGPHV